MTIAPTPTLVTPEDLLRMPDAVNYELVDGQLVERHMGMESSEVGGQVLFLVKLFLRDQKDLGRAFGSDAGYQCFPGEPNKIRKPDVSFVRADRLPADWVSLGYCPVPPDLAVEVVSPNDLAYEVDEKVVEYLRAGVPLVWVVSPPTRTVRIHRPRTSPRGPISELADGDTIDGEDALPNFTCPVRDFFQP